MTPIPADAEHTVTHRPDDRHIRVEGLKDEDGGRLGWMEFSYDDDGFLEVEGTSDNVRYTRKKTGIGEVTWRQVNAAWAAAFEVAPKSRNHPVRAFPIGSTWSDASARGGRVVGYDGGWGYINIPGIGRRSVPIRHMRAK